MKMIIGYIGYIGKTDIPLILDCAIRLENGLISLGDPANGNICIEEHEFDDMVQRGDAGRIESYLEYDSNSVFVFTPGINDPSYLKIDVVEKSFKALVLDCREFGHKYFKRGQMKDALMWFDWARRLSNEADDYVRVYMIDNENKEIWLEWLKMYAPEVDVLKRAVELGIENN